VTQYYNIPLSKKQISEIFCISDVTISKTFRKIWPYHKIVLSNKITDLILEKKNSIVKNDSKLNKSNLIINNYSDSEEKTTKKTKKSNKKYLINEDSDENNSNKEYEYIDNTDDTDDTEDSEQLYEYTKNKNEIVN